MLCVCIYIYIERERDPPSEVPGIDFYPFEAGAGSLPPRKRPTCELGPMCTAHSRAHHAEFAHPWMRPGPEVVLKRKRHPG